MNLTLAGYQDMANKGRVVHMVGPLDYDKLNGFHKSLREASEKHREEPLAILVTSGGGSLGIAIAMTNEIRALATTGKVYMIGTAFVQSAAVSIMMAVPVEQRFSLGYTSYYCHRTSHNRKYEICGHLDQHDYHIKEYEAGVEDFSADTNWLFEQIVKGTTMTRKEFNDLIEHPKALNNKEAKRRGIIAGVLE